MAQIKFGTDGWRAIIAEDFTFTNLERVAQATAAYWLRNPVPGTEKRIVIGYDRRFLSDQFAARTAEIMLGNGFGVTLTSVPTPTPAVSFAVKAQRAIGGGDVPSDLIFRYLSAGAGVNEGTDFIRRQGAAVTFPFDE